MKPVRVDQAGWQIECWKLAEAKKSFEVAGFSDRHQTFGVHLCASFGYMMKRKGEKTVFTPLQPN